MAQAVIELVARAADRVAGLDSRLLHDLGIDGDDALMLFQRYEREFGVDLTNLYANWDQHFGPEGIPLKTGLAWLGMSLLAALPWIWAGAPQWVCLLAGMLGGFAGLIALGRLFPNPPLHPITVADMIAAAETGHWPEIEVPGA